MKMKYLLLFGFLAGCSSGGGGSSVPGARISENASRSLTGQAAVFEAGRTLTGDGSRSRSLQFMASANMAPPEPSVIANKSKSAYEAMLGSIGKNQCKKEFGWTPVAGKIEGSAAAFRPFSLTVKGINCPLELELSIEMPGLTGKPCTESDQNSSCSFTAKMKMVYQVRDDQLAKELGVRSGSAILNMTMNNTFPASSTTGGMDARPNEMNMAMKADSDVAFKAVDLEGQVQLVSGTSNIDVTMTVPEMKPDQPSSGMPFTNGAFKEDLRYLNQADNTSVTLLATGKISGENAQESYLINGKPVNQEEYIKQRNLFAISLMNLEIDPSQQQPQPQPNPPQPQPAPQPGHPLWACVIQSSTDKSVYIGYGAIEDRTGCDIESEAKLPGFKRPLQLNNDLRRARSRFERLVLRTEKLSNWKNL